MTNTATELLGTFSIYKQVDGDFPLDDPALDDVSIPINYSYTDLDTDEEVTGTLTLNRANDFAETGPALPEGTMVTVEEGTPTGGPPDLEWGDAVDGGRGGVRASGVLHDRRRHDCRSCGDQRGVPARSAPS